MNIVEAYIALTQQKVQQTNRSAWQQMAKMCNSFHILFGLIKWHDVTVREMYVVLGLFIIMEILQSTTNSYSETIPLETLEFII
jgi:hypothetical protein